MKYTTKDLLGEGRREAWIEVFQDDWEKFSSLMSKITITLDSSPLSPDSEHPLQLIKTFHYLHLNHIKDLTVEMVRETTESETFRFEPWMIQGRLKRIWLDKAVGSLFLFLMGEFGIDLPFLETT